MGLPKLDKLKDAKGWRAFRVDFWAMCVVEECVDAIDAPMRVTREQQRRAHKKTYYHPSRISPQHVAL
ncbi:hypothetical protein CHLRE_02g102200v5 [Chlamydomonas reinhardtii]|uniref:Uncharacterized protein EZY6 n=1 Tax=Chlamydomonas reinhardtii TaxID=3055 RepID=A2PZB7_CHLRE|nr:uncharacterized protein CHLRE_02g102200v5 [Chlamydomonas reinhardtii]PNW86939.1 hypothetical protein CHLRE_02g102200v5 [Chlamydomonas reinhardtii]BAF46279.1 hypothetical protein [Chlamydomonas reinhardtii]